MKLTTLLMLGLGLVEVEAKTDKDQKMKKKQKDKKSRMLRNLRKEAPVTLNDDGDVTFYNEAISIQCLTGQGDYAGMGAELTNTEAKALVCQIWLNELKRIDNWLQATFQIGLLTEEEIDYTDDSERLMSGNMWGLDEGPNAKNTVTALKKICENEIIPEDYPPFGYNCIGGFTYSNGDHIDHSECRQVFRRAEHKRSRKVCRKEIRNRSGNKGKWLEQ